MRLAVPAQPNVDVGQLSDAVQLQRSTATDYAIAGGILVGSWIVGRIVRTVLSKALERGQADAFIAELIGRLASYLIVVFGLVYALDSLGVAIGPALGALGIVGIALAFALQDLLENFVAGVLLQLRRPFTAGDEVVAGDYQGAVVRVDARAVVINTPDGEIVRLPSASVIKNPIVNLTARRARRTTVDVGVAYGTDLALATRLLSSAVAATEGVLPAPAPQIVATGFGESSIDLAVRFWHEPSIASVWQVRHAVVLTIERALSEAGIQIPFPQRVIHAAEDPADR